VPAKPTSKKLRLFYSYYFNAFKRIIFVLASERKGYIFVLARDLNRGKEKILRM